MSASWRCCKCIQRPVVPWNIDMSEVCRYALVARLGIYDTGDLISERSGYFESEVGSPNTTDAMKRTCWRDICMKMDCRDWDTSPRPLHYMWSALTTELPRQAHWWLNSTSGGLKMCHFRLEITRSLWDQISCIILICLTQIALALHCFVLVIFIFMFNHGVLRQMKDIYNI